VVFSDCGRRHGLEVEGFPGERLVVRPRSAPRDRADVLAASLLEDGTPIVIPTSTTGAPSTRTRAVAGCGATRMAGRRRPGGAAIPS
jgi:hypothetical protein